MSERRHVLVKLMPVGALLLAVAGGPASAAQPEEQASAQPEGLRVLPLLRRPALDDGRRQLDLAVSALKGGGAPAKAGGKVKNLNVKGRGKRLAPEATTDVWTLGNFAYTGSFNSPCGGEAGGGVHVWDVEKAKKTKLETVIDSPTGSRSNDVKVASMNSGDILVHSNERCGVGPGGFEIYDVDDPKNPVFLASVEIDELNPISDFLFGGISDVSVHNLWLFTQGDKDYVAAVAGTAFDTFMIFDITDPSSPTSKGAWGAEEIFDLGVGELTDLGDSVEVDRALNAAFWLLDGFGASRNRFLHDITISADGLSAYLSNWDAGLVLLDISDPANPALVSVALDVANGSLDGEVNSHAAWPNEDGTVVVETEEDFTAWEATTPPGNLILASGGFPGDPTIPGTAISTVAGDDFEANQTGNVGSTDGASVVVTSGPLAGNTYPAIELATAAGSPTFGTTGPLSGELVWIGQGCATSVGDVILNVGDVDPGDIVVVRRGACFFEEKADTAASLGAAAVVIANNVTSTPWSGVRVWDYSDPANPVLASTFNTTCSASTAPSAECSVSGTYSAHNVQLVGDLAYISWYSDGVLILDVSDPASPKEVGRYNRTDAKFEAKNGGPQNVWGIYVDTEREKDNIFASDRNGGLYVLKQFKGKKKK